MLEPGSVDKGVLCGSPSVCKFVYPPYLCRETYELNVFYVATGFITGLLALPAGCGRDHQWIVPLRCSHS